MLIPGVIVTGSSPPVTPSPGWGPLKRCLPPVAALIRRVVCGLVSIFPQDSPQSSQHRPSAHLEKRTTAVVQTHQTSIERDICSGVSLLLPSCWWSHLSSAVSVDSSTSFLAQSTHLPVLSPSLSLNFCSVHCSCILRVSTSFRNPSSTSLVTSYMAVFTTDSITSESCV